MECKALPAPRFLLDRLIGVLMDQNLDLGNIADESSDNATLIGAQTLKYLLLNEIVLDSILLKQFLILLCMHCVNECLLLLKAHHRYRRQVTQRKQRFLTESLAVR